MPSFGQNTAWKHGVFAERVKVERARRLEVGTDVNLQGYGWVALRGRPDDQQALANLDQMAAKMVALGYVQEVLPFRGRDNVVHPLTAPQIVDLYLQGGQYVQAIYAASWALIDAPVHVSDPESDEYWPPRGVAP